MEISIIPCNITRYRSSVLEHIPYVLAKSGKNIKKISFSLICFGYDRKLHLVVLASMWGMRLHFAMAPSTSLVRRSVK